MDTKCDFYFKGNTLNAKLGECLNLIFESN